LYDISKGEGRISHPIQAIPVYLGAP